MTYRVKVYRDAHSDNPSQIVNASSLEDAMRKAANEVQNLESETDEFGFGSAGDDELFEVYPVGGHGTVVVDRI